VLSNLARLILLPLFSASLNQSSQAQPDSIPQIVAESQGMQRLPASEWPTSGTFWQMLRAAFLLLCLARRKTQTRPFFRWLTVNI
jgi:hypothetical protein